MHNKLAKYLSGMFNFLFLALLNLLYVLILGFMTMDSNANWNSRLGALFLSFFISIFFAYQTPNVSGLKRMFMFGSGLYVYLILAMFQPGLRVFIPTLLWGCIIVAEVVLFYGNDLTSRRSG